MNKAAILLICTVLAAASSLATCHDPTNVKYIDFSLWPTNRKANIEGTRNALIAINADLNDNSDTMIKKINVLLNRSNPNSHEYTVCLDLLNLSRSFETRTQLLTNRVMEILAILNDPTFQPQKPFADFLFHFGKNRFKGQLQSVEAKLISRSEENNQAVIDLDLLFAESFGLERYNNNEILQMLTALDLAESYFDGGRAMKVALDLGKHKETDRKIPINILFAFISRKCYELRKGREFPINVLTLAVTFGLPPDNLMPEVRKLLEYNRLCASLLREGKRVKENLARQLRCHNLFDTKYLDWSLLKNTWNANIEETKDALYAINAYMSQQQGSILSRLKSLLGYRKGRISPHQADVYRDLIDLTKHPRKNWKSVTERVANRVMEICAILNDPTFKPQTHLIEYLLEHGEARFGHQIQPVQDELLNCPEKINPPVRDLDLLFTESFGLKTCNNHEILQMLIALDLAESQFDGNRALEVALTLKKWDEAERKQTDIIVFAFIFRKCHDFRVGHELHINVLTLAVSFGFPPDKLKTEVRKLLEYNRLCASLLREGKRVKENLARQLRCHNLFDTKYLDWSLLENNWNTNIEETKDALYAIYAYKSDQQVNILSKLMGLLRKHEGSLSPHQVIVYLDLAALADPHVACTESVTNRVMEICAILNDPKFQPQEQLAKFLFDYGKPKFGGHIPVVQDSLTSETRENIEALLVLDELFVKSLGWDTFNDEESLEILGSLDLTTSEFGVNKALEIALNLGTWNEEERKNPIALVYTFMNAICTNFQRGREFNINVLTLAVTFGFPSEVSPIRVKKLIEYNRLCASLRREQKRVMDNLAEQLVRENRHGHE